MSHLSLPQVQLTVSPLPTLTKEDELLCLFGESPPHLARVEGDAVVCSSPGSIPSTPPGQGAAQLPFLHAAVHLFRLLWQGLIPQSGW